MIYKITEKGGDEKYRKMSNCEKNQKKINITIKDR